MTDASLSLDTQQPATTHAPTWRWLLEGLRAGFFLRPRMAGRAPRPLQVLLLSVSFELLVLGLTWLWIVGPAAFSGRVWLASWWMVAPLLWVSWWALSLGRGDGGGPRLQGLGSWYTLTVGAAVPAQAAFVALGALSVHGWLLPQATGFVATALWALQWGLVLWHLAVMVVLMARFARRVVPTVIYTAVLVGVFAVSMLYMDLQTWRPRVDSAASAPVLNLSQEGIERQQAVWQDAVQALAPERPGTVDVYGLVFAPYAAEDVFRRESGMVAEVLRQRFDAEGRVLQLLNHAETNDELPWATSLNLERGLQALAARMDREQDLLVVYLTSHGGGDFHLAANHWPLQVQPITPQLLRAALDRVGIRNRVIAVSACYSGGWVAPLATPTSLVMTAADETHTSYGCGHKSPLTFFGRALFDEELRKTHDFRQAFANAVPVIQQREEEAGKDDGFSNPQISVGEDIAPVLEALRLRLEAKS
ncbi:C13 family peptidase [Xylophilus sp. GW821-FHT01B05]